MAQRVWKFCMKNHDKKENKMSSMDLFGMLKLYYYLAY